MTKTILDRANAINSRLGKINAFLEQLDQTDPSGIDTTSRFSPIAITCGMAQTIDFAHHPNVDTDVQRLDNQTRDWIIQGVKNYKAQLERMFNEI